MIIEFNNKIDCEGEAIFGTKTIRINPSFIFDKFLISPLQLAEKELLEQLEEEFIEGFTEVMTHEIFHILLKPFQLILKFDEEKIIKEVI